MPANCFPPSLTLFAIGLKHLGMHLCFCAYKFKAHLMFQIHRLLSKHFGSFLESKTFNKQHSKAGSDGGSYIQIRMRVRGPRPLRQNNNKEEPRYMH